MQMLELPEAPAQITVPAPQSLPGCIRRGEAFRITVPFIVEIPSEIEVLVYHNPEDAGQDHEEDSFRAEGPYKNLSVPVREALACDREQRKAFERAIAEAVKKARRESAAYCDGDED